MVSSIAKLLTVTLPLGFMLAGNAQADMIVLPSAFVAVANALQSRAVGAGKYSVPLLRVEAQVLGQRCVTRIGTCAIEPQPVGSPCSCGAVKGVTSQ